MASIRPDYDHWPQKKKGAYTEAWGQPPQDEIGMKAGVPHQQVQRQVSLSVHQALILSPLTQAITISIALSVWSSSYTVTLILQRLALASGQDQLNIGKAATV
ncbi:hypothetical protein SCAR479_11852 [Seiridium cardinale]|uniref:Uncharacterized protein n=1 Tax=Seiridium cardinale TaxID=138064 RepID=A0ABR2XCJ7_9PEZI